MGTGHYVLAQALQELGELEEARGHYRRALDIFIKTWNGKHERVSAAALALAEVLRELGETDAVLGLYQQALDVDEELDPGGKYLVETLETFADFLDESGDAAGAQRLRQRAREMRQ